MISHDASPRGPLQRKVRWSACGRAARGSPGPIPSAPTSASSPPPPRPPRSRRPARPRSVSRSARSPRESVPRPSRAAISDRSSRFPPSSPAIRPLGLAGQLVGGDHEDALRFLVGRVDDLEITPGRGPAELHPRSPTALDVAARGPQDLLDFFLRDPVPIDVGQARGGVEVEADVHEPPPCNWPNFIIALREGRRKRCLRLRRLTA